jgi:hypothetical protein
MEISIGDLLDRSSILKLKSERTEVKSTPERVALEEAINLYITGLDEYNLDFIVDCFNDLYEVNGKIWDLEADIRKGKEGELGLEEVGRRALAIRDLNGKRVEVKNNINHTLGSGFTETKVNHASEKSSR